MKRYTPHLDTDAIASVSIDGALVVVATMDEVKDGDYVLFDDFPKWQDMTCPPPKAGSYLVWAGFITRSNWQPDGFDDGWGIHAVSHWMELPEPPCEG